MYIFGIILTVLWALVVPVLIFNNWNTSVSEMRLNEWGDFFAGVTAPMAFLWLIIGYHLQRNEIKHNTESLKEQKEELSAQKDELAKQNDLTKENIEATKELAKNIEHVGREISSTITDLIRYGNK